VGKLEFGVWDQMQTYEVMTAASAADVYDTHIRQAKLMEAAGFGYYWTLEHQGSYVGAITSPSVFLSALARETESLRLGTMIWQLPFHNPVRLAEEVAMLDHLSRGRAEFGAGIGVHEHEFIRWGMNFYDRQEMGDEVMDVIEMAWSGKPVTYHGKFYDFEDALVQPQPYNKQGIPIWSAVHSPRAMEFAARRGYNMAQNIDTDESMAAKFADWRRMWTAAGHAGPMPRQFLMRVVHVAETDAKAREQAEQYIMEANTLGRELVATSRVGFGVNPRGTGTEDTPTSASAAASSASRPSHSTSGSTTVWRWWGAPRRSPARSPRAARRSATTTSRASSISAACLTTWSRNRSSSSGGKSSRRLTSPSRIQEAP